MPEIEAVQHTMAEVIAEIETLIGDAKVELREALADDQNSYGSGYEAGFLDACRQIYNFIFDAEVAP